ncbi:AF4/FMR2 family member lilli-like [Bactrocera neohumeralis]|uniref:AF4/FMR2 family member lilli-like n=1 Tax=Bactrocera neohumeralis TaxID=98809 RepID=UPI002164FD05|nr:AF4/FMR2 family member lilli-like [Bactrocera neohumeralis]
MGIDAFSPDADDEQSVSSSTTKLRPGRMQSRTLGRATAAAVSCRPTVRPLSSPGKRSSSNLGAGNGPRTQPNSGEGSGTSLSTAPSVMSSMHHAPSLFYTAAQNQTSMTNLGQRQRAAAVPAAAGRQPLGRNRLRRLGTPTAKDVRRNNSDSSGQVGARPRAGSSGMVGAVAAGGSDKAGQRASVPSLSVGAGLSSGRQEKRGEHDRRFAGRKCLLMLPQQTQQQARVGNASSGGRRADRKDSSRTIAQTRSCRRRGSVGATTRTRTPLLPARATSKEGPDATLGRAGPNSKNKARQASPAALASPSPTAASATRTTHSATCAASSPKYRAPQQHCRDEWNGSAATTAADAAKQEMQPLEPLQDNYYSAINLAALRMDDSGTADPLRYEGSHPADKNGKKPGNEGGRGGAGTENASHLGSSAAYNFSFRSGAVPASCSHSASGFHHHHHHQQQQQQPKQCKSQRENDFASSDSIMNLMEKVTMGAAADGDLLQATAVPRHWGTSSTSLQETVAAAASGRAAAATTATITTQVATKRKLQRNEVTRTRARATANNNQTTTKKKRRQQRVG